ncbi:MAG: SDR family oxidoreductase [Candidatus Accumulibacter sp. UW20]|jgi:NAD(P)-dependent dehydrogenase (short-subunit alcohol dehydrogenase family)
MQEQTFPPQHQEQQPGRETQMQPPPQSRMADYRGSGKLQDRVALITGGDSGIGRAVAVAFAKEGAAVAIGYLNEHEDAAETQRLVEETGAGCLLLPGDIGDEATCRRAVEETLARFGRLDVLVNNAAEQYPQEDFTQISAEQIERTFRTNVFAMFYLAKAALPHLGDGASIINTTSVTAYRGSERLLDYSATKGAIVSFTRSLSRVGLERGIRVNAVAPGPVWTPLIPASFPAAAVEKFGGHAPLGRAAQPDEIAPCYVFLASHDSAYITGQVLHPNGGEIVNG